MHVVMLPIIGLCARDWWFLSTAARIMHNVWGETGIEPKEARVLVSFIKVQCSCSARQVHAIPGDMLFSHLFVLCCSCGSCSWRKDQIRAILQGRHPGEKGALMSKVTLLLPPKAWLRPYIFVDCQKSKFKTNPKFNFVKYLNIIDKYHVKVLLKRFHLNGHTIGLHPLTQKVEAP